VRRMLLGSVAESLLRTAHMPVLLVRHDPRAESTVGRAL
jgi:nucleotide-binding universal stress UspA family protein